MDFLTIIYLFVSPTYLQSQRYLSYLRTVLPVKILDQPLVSFKVILIFTTRSHIASVVFTF